MGRSNRAARWRALQMLRLGMFHPSVIRSSRHARRVRKGIVQRTAQSVAPTPAKPEPRASHMNGMEPLQKRDPIRTLPP